MSFREWGVKDPISGSGGARSLVSSSTGVSADTTALGVADVYRLTAAGTTLTIQTADITEGRVFVIRAIAASGGSPNTVDTQGAETIDGGSSITLTNPYASVTLHATGGVLESIS